MSAFLKKLFKPKWKSSNAITRKEYIATLNPSTEEDKNILLDLARNDSDNQVRRAAINKIDSISTLLNLYQEPSELIKPAVKDRLEGLAKSNALPIYELITDETLLTELIINSDNAEQYQGALLKLSPSTLETIAVSAKLSQLRLAAVERVVEEAHLASIEKQAKAKDKRVYQLAKSKLKEIKAHKKQQAEVKEKQESVIESLEAHAKSETVKLYGAKLTSLLDSWNDISDGADEALIRRFEISKQASLAKAAQLKQDQEQEALVKQQSLQQKNERDETLNILEQTAERFKQTPVESASELPALDAIIKTQETRWLEATRESTVEKSEQKQYQQLMGDLKHYLKSAQAFMSGKDQFTSPEAGDDQATPNRQTASHHEIRAFIDKVNWPDGFATPRELKSLRKFAGNIAEKKKQTIQVSDQQKSQIEEQITRLEQHLGNRALKQSSQGFKELNHLIHGLDKGLASNYAGRLQLLGKQLNELRDWHGYAVTPKQAELCEQAEKLIEQHLAPQVKADKIKALQDEWKKLGGSSDQKIWQRFKTACDTAYAPCRDYFDEQRTVKRNNIEKRKTICTQLSDFISQNDWDNTDWKAVEKINRVARDEWKECYPVEFKENKAVQKIFNELLAKMDQYLNDERSRNKALKQAIVEKTQALVTHEPLSEAIEQAKSLQSEWQKVGITLHKDDRALWKEYRAACDEIFKRRDAENESKQQAINEAIAQAEAICAEAEQASRDINENCDKTLSEFRQRFRGVSPLPKKELERLSQKLEQTLSDIASNQAKQRVAQEHSTWLGLNKKSKLIRDAAEKLQSGATLDSAALFAQELTPPQNEQISNIEQVLFDTWKIAISAVDINSEYATAEQAKSLCIQCEIAAEIDSPQEDQALRMQLQVNRLSEGLNQKDSSSKRDELEKYLSEWFQLCLIPAEVRTNLETRVDSVLAKVTA
ncbi:DUF349 domain-containing protein [Alkalimarinus coralli]|uniref:DUF349 domain-containing protein n=1 Tax=Alkalimarinus coralli TaxID=2935863 RepID=UPI00202B586A|nr:DUF349 domain-containing protein [Alkalimarinus coralli]